MTKILAIDTSTDACSAALLFDDQIFERFMIAPQQHTKLILPMISELLTETCLELNQLDAIAFGCGPGSFTGVRLAASITQGFACVANLPVVRISTLCALAQEVWEKRGAQKVIVAQDARMQEIYWGKYQISVDGIMRAVGPDKLSIPTKVTTDGAEGFIGVGGAWEIYGDILKKNCSISIIESLRYPQAKYVGKLAVVDFVGGFAVSAAEAIPEYLREEVAWK